MKEKLNESLFKCNKLMELESLTFTFIMIVFLFVYCAQKYTIINFFLY